MEQFMDAYGILNINARQKVRSAINIRKKVTRKERHFKNESTLDTDFSSLITLKNEDPYDTLYQKMQET